MKYCICGLFIIEILGIAFAQEKHPVTPADIVNLVEISDPQLSPDGKKILFEITQPASDGQIRTSDIWSVTVEGNGKPKPFIESPHNEKRPRWSEDGSLIAFLSDNSSNGIVQIFVRPLNEGGENRQITFSEQEVVRHEWLHQNDRIAFISSQAAKAEDSSSEEQFGHADKIPGAGLQHLYEIDLNTGAVEMISVLDEQVNSFDISLDNKKVAYCAAASADWNDISYHSRLVIFNRKTKERRYLTEIAGDLIMSVDMGNVRWAPDAGSVLHFTRYGRVYAMLPCLTYESSATGNHKIIAEDYTGTIWEMDWINNHLILVSSQEGTEGTISTYNLKNGKIQKLAHTGIEWGWPNNWSMDKKGQWVVYKKAAVEHAEDIWIMKTDGSNCRQLTDLNPQVKEWMFGSEEVITWHSHDGKVIEGVLIKPAGYEPGKTYPLITIIHGGPEWSWWQGWHAAWHQWGQFLASTGYAVLLPNPRGSNGYGWKFVEENVMDWGGSDFQDVMTGIDYVVGMGVADSSRLGIGGWSYGGYLAAWAVTHTGRFKAAVMGAGLSDLVSFYDITPCQSVFEAYFGTSAHENKDLYECRSPLNYCKNVETPLLILHGQNDSGVDVSQAQRFYNELMKEGKIARIIVYPDEGHHFSRRDSQIDSLSRILDWFDSYL